MQNKKFKLGDLFTEQELEKAAKLKDAKAICIEIVSPRMDHINQVTGQKNDAMFLSYFLEYVFQTNTLNVTHHEIN